MSNLIRALERHSWAANLAFNILLALLCALSYLFLLLLYFCQGLRVTSWTYVNQGTVPPTAIIPVFTVILTGATSALLTRLVEHDLWIRLVGPTPNSTLGDDARRRAQWSVSPIARLLYMATGQSVPLRIGGVLLFGTAVLNPVLLYGVSPGVELHKSTEQRAPAEHSFAGFTPSYDTSQYEDTFMKFASLASLNGMKASASDVCSDSSCTVVAQASVLQAECEVFTRWFEIWNMPIFDRVTRCSRFGNTTCVTAVSQGFNFSTGISNECRQSSPRPNATSLEGVCPPGDFAVLKGAWNSVLYALGNTQEEHDAKLPDVERAGITRHEVDCRIRHGTAPITQTGDSPPEMDRASFRESTSSITPFLEGQPPPYVWFTANPAWLWQAEYIYGKSPYVFASNGSGISLDHDLATSLLRLGRSGDSILANDTEMVARSIEANFDMANLLAFARAPNASALEITTTTETDLWVYDARVLPILALPLLATILVLCACRRVGSDDVVIGYDPLGIARRADEVLAGSSEPSKNETAGNGGLGLAASKGAYSAVSVRPTSLGSGDGQGESEGAGSPVPRLHASTGDVRRGDGPSAPLLDEEDHDSGGENPRPLASERNGSRTGERGFSEDLVRERDGSIMGRHRTF